jgi:hypothetical protein
VEGYGLTLFSDPDSDRIRIRAGKTDLQERKSEDFKFRREDAPSVAWRFEVFHGGLR